jgi:hypothetical protein
MPLLNTGSRNPAVGQEGPRGNSVSTTARVTGLLWLLLSALASTGLTASTPATPQAEDFLVSSFGAQRGSVGDLDGDGRPDLAVVRDLGWGSKGFLYGIQIQLTAHDNPSSFQVSARESGLLIISRDVTGDRFPDLIITSASSFTPVGVWVNDGRGGFTQGDPSAYPADVWHEGSGLCSNPNRDLLPADLPQSRRPLIDFSLKRDIPAEEVVEHLLRPATRVKVLRNKTNPPPSRAPPIL